MRLISVLVGDLDGLLILMHGNYGKCVGGTSTCVMISEVLFGYFLFEEKVTDASALKQVASLLHRMKHSLF